MRSRSFGFLVLLILVLGFVRWQIPPSGSPEAGDVAATVKAKARAEVPLPASALEPQESVRAQTLVRLAYAQGWNRELPPAMAAFRAWAERYRATEDRAARVSLEAEGVALARARRTEMLNVIKTDPQRALAITVPAVLRQSLPSAVLVELETRVAGRGEYALLASQLAPGETEARPAYRRIALLNGVSYSAHPYGRREAQLTKEGASLHGIALDRDLALHESPLRVLEPGEIPASTAGAECPVSDLPIALLSLAAEFNADALTVVEAEGRVVEFCGGENMLETFEQRLTDAEEGPGPRVAALRSGDGRTTLPGVEADAPTSHTIGTMQMLVVRVDFSDVAGEPITAAAAQSVMDTAAKPFLEEASYGQATLVATVSTKVYRLPQTASAYALAANEGQLHADARTLAGADYTVATYDRVIVVFANISTPRIPGSLIAFAGEGTVGGTNVWINGSTSFNLGTLSHELGHTHGLKHANLWRVTDGNPLSSAGTTLEYGDPFDMMGSTGTTRDRRHHYSPWAKNLLGWLPDSAVTKVTTSGTYRVYRFDSKDAPRTQPLALRIFRDGVRSYWVGLRQNFATGTPTANGAYVTWGFNNLQQSQLLDLTTPGVSANDAVLAIGATFSDPAYGITIKPVARGGTEPAQYLDVEVTVPVTPPNVVTAWGRENAFIFDGNGLPIVPTPETYVPFGLIGVSAIAAGDLHALALKPDGTVVAWGDNTNGQTTLPAGLANVASVAAGGNVSGVVKRDGTVQLWGEALGNVTTPPVGLTGVKQLAIGGGHSVGIYHGLALKTDGTVVAWGDNTRSQATPPAGLSGVVAIAASDRLSVALKSDGTVVRWGTTFIDAIVFPTGLSGVTAIASSGGAQYALALKADGSVVAWGANSRGQATLPAGLSNVIAIATGNSHSLALKADGSVVAWGSNTSGQLNIPPALPRAYALAASSSASFALTGSHVYLLSPPQAQTVAAGGTATISVTATGSGTLTYQWRRDGVVIPGATANALSLSNVSAANAAAYDVVVTDATGTLTSFPARLTVLPPNTALNPGRLINLSILTTISAADPLFTVGTVIGGANTVGPKPILVRAAGPSLAALGVATPMADPKLELFSGQTVVAANDNWGGTAALSNAFASVGAFAYTAVGSRDAAVFNPALASGGYTVQVSGVAGSTGTVIAELYDATAAGSFVATTPRLVNVSVLKQINAGETLTAGFVVGGATAKQILIRAVGPTLGVAPFGIPGTMADPKLDLYSGQTVINTNDNWGGGVTLATAFASVGAFALGTTSKDAAILVTLAPGNYTAQVSGVSGSGGLTLVEVYEVP